MSGFSKHLRGHCALFGHFPQRCSLVVLSLLSVATKFVRDLGDDLHLTAMAVGLMIQLKKGRPCLAKGSLRPKIQFKERSSSTQLSWLTIPSDLETFSFN